MYSTAHLQCRPNLGNQSPIRTLGPVHMSEVCEVVFALCDVQSGENSLASPFLTSQWAKINLVCVDRALVVPVEGKI